MPGTSGSSYPMCKSGRPALDQLWTRGKWCRNYARCIKLGWAARWRKPGLRYPLAALASGCFHGYWSGAVGGAASSLVAAALGGACGHSGEGYVGLHTALLVIVVTSGAAGVASTQAGSDRCTPHSALGHAAQGSWQQEV